MVLYSLDWTNIWFSFNLLTVNLFGHPTLIEHGLYHKNNKDHDRVIVFVYFYKKINGMGIELTLYKTRLYLFRKFLKVIGDKVLQLISSLNGLRSKILT